MAITPNKNAVHGDKKSAAAPGGVRLAPPPSMSQVPSLERQLSAAKSALTHWCSGFSLRPDPRRSFCDDQHAGAPALTTRGFEAADFEQVAELLHEAVTLARAFPMPE